MSNSSGWIGVDLDGTLAHYEGWNEGKIGEPVPAMAERVKQWLADGVNVRIFTARVAGLWLVGATEAVKKDAENQLTLIRQWTELHFGEFLPVTAVKDFAMIELWDDRSISVEPNTGRVLTEGAK